MITNKKFSSPRNWSNEELKKFSHLFDGSVANVSGWKDEDKQGRHYRDYFVHCKEYAITNYKSEARGFQGQDNEIFLDLTKDLPANLQERFDVVFNHTVLEHIFEVHKAVENLCLMSRDIVIVVVPFLQPMHAEYGDYWRFTPSCLHKLFAGHGFKTLYSSFNNDIGASVYLFHIASRHPERWANKIKSNLSASGEPDCTARPFFKDGFEEKVGTNAIIDLPYRVCNVFRVFLSKIFKSLR